jgi:hypothetical protein
MRMKREEKRKKTSPITTCLVVLIEKEADGRMADGKNPGLGLKGAQGEPVNLEAELGRNSRDEPACLMGWLHSPCGGEAEKRHQDPTQDRSIGNFYRCWSGRVSCESCALHRAQPGGLTSGFYMQRVRRSTNKYTQTSADHGLNLTFLISDTSGEI